LEDRLTPSLADGTLLVATAPSSYASDDQSSFPTGILSIDPGSGGQTVLATGGPFSLPGYITEGPHQQLYITDLTAFGTGAIFQIDPNTGQASVLATGGLLNGPKVLAFLNGSLYIANAGDGTGSVHTLVKINPATGQQSLVTSGGGFTVPTGMVPAPGNNVYVTDEPGGYQSPEAGMLWEVNLDTGQQTLLSRGGLLDHPVDVALESSGHLIVANTGSPSNAETGSLIRINPQTGAQTWITSFGPSSGTNSAEVGPEGTIFVGNIAEGLTAGQIIQVDPMTGAHSPLCTGGDLSLVGGIRVFHAGVLTTATTTLITSSTNPSPSGQSVTFTATISPAAPSAGAPTGVVQFQIDGLDFGNPVSVSTAEGITTASFGTSTLAVGTHPITACYEGDGSFAASSGTLSGCQVVTTNGNRGGVVIVSQNPTTGVLSLTGYNDDDTLALQQISPGVLQVAGINTLLNQSADPLGFLLNSIQDIDIHLLDGNDSVTLADFGIAGTLSISAGSGSDTFALSAITANLVHITARGPGKDTVNVNKITAGSVSVSTGDNATLSLRSVMSAGLVSLAAAKNAAVSVDGLTAAGDLNITLGDNARSVSVKGSSSYNLNILQTGTTGNPPFDLENDTVNQNLELSAGDGNNSLIVSQLKVGLRILVRLGAGKNQATVDQVSASVGNIDGGPGGNNLYLDGGGNSGFSVSNFIGH
jgi:hypothetical protein